MSNTFSDPSLKPLDIPYIPMYRWGSLFEEALKAFPDNYLGQFERATMFRDGEMLKDNGRWVYVGAKTLGKAEPDSEEPSDKYCAHPKSSDMLIIQTSKTSGQKSQKFIDDGHTPHARTADMFIL